MTATRRLAALMFTDIVGYSAMTFEDEQLSRKLVKEHREIVRECLKKFNGREHQTMGDGFFVEFASAIEAVRCAVEIQTLLRDRSTRVASSHQIQVRIGIHLGDITEDEKDMYGNSINIAARVEPMAPAGGICITRQVHEQVDGKIDGLKFKKLGHKPLKNIKSGAEVFLVQLPWTVATSSKSKFKSFDYRVKAVAFALAVCCLVPATVSIYAPKTTSYYRGPASVSASRVPLNQGWTYQLPGRDFLAYDTAATWNYGDKIQGPYVLKKTFSVPDSYEHPAIVLGLITDSHRAFINGHFIGGSETFGNLAFYSFDKRLLKTTENTLTIEGRTKASLNPGLTVLPEVGAFLAEDTEVQNAVFKNQLRYQILRNIYFTLALVFSILCFAYAYLRKAKPIYYYSAFLLLLGALHLSYYNPWFTTSFNYPFIRFVKLLSLILTSFTLCSGVLHMSRKGRQEMVNNILAIAVTLILAVTTLFPAHTAEQFMKLYNFTLMATAAYTLGWLMTRSSGAFKTKNPFAIAFVYFGIINLISLVISLKQGVVSNQVPSWIRTLMMDTSLLTPFLFSLFLAVAFTWDYVRSSRAAEAKKQKDEFILELLHSVNKTTDTYTIISEILDRACKFLEAERSTLYIFEKTENGTGLKANHAVGNFTHFTVRQRLLPKQGVIAHVLQTKEALLLTDIHQDLRFKTMTHETYRTGTCMVLPLKRAGRLMGVLTFADKSGVEPFTQSDFNLALELAAAVSLLQDNLQSKLAA